MLRALEAGKVPDAQLESRVTFGKIYVERIRL